MMRLPPGIRIIESTAAVTHERVRVYAKRRAKSPRHWARMDKKYLKRYGTTPKPTMYFMNLSLSGRGGGQTLVVHPSLMPTLKAAVPEAFAPRSYLDNFI